MEPMMLSGERITVAVIAFDKEKCDALKTLSPSRLAGMFDDQATAMSNMIDMVVSSALKQGQSGSLDDFKSPLSGVSLGAVREALGNDLADVLRQAAMLSSSFYEQN